MPRSSANTPKDSPSLRNFLTPKEVAAERHTTEETLSRERTAGEGPAFYKIGGRVFYDREDLDSWYARRRRNAEAA
jgi:hypothetical protein